MADNDREALVDLIGNWANSCEIPPHAALSDLADAILDGGWKRDDLAAAVADYLHKTMPDVPIYRGATRAESFAQKESAMPWRLPEHNYHGANGQDYCWRCEIDRGPADD